MNVFVVHVTMINCRQRIEILREIIVLYSNINQRTTNWQFGRQLVSKHESDTYIL